MIDEGRLFSRKPGKNPKAGSDSLTVRNSLRSRVNSLLRPKKFAERPKKIR
jgi:hypothetical protein